MWIIQISTVLLKFLRKLLFFQCVHRYLQVYIIFITWQWKVTKSQPSYKMSAKFFIFDAVNNKVDGAFKSYAEMRNRDKNVHFLSPELLSWNYNYNYISIMLMKDFKLWQMTNTTMTMRLVAMKCSLFALVWIGGKSLSFFFNVL